MTPQRWRQLQATFDAALNEAPEERFAFLENACAGDHDLLAEVQGLLVHQMKAECADFLPSLTVPGSTPSPTNTPDLAGRLDLAGYEVFEELGRGGMGVVYRARQVRLNRQVALKVILAGGHAGPQDLARFRAEVEILASLQHPNIVQIYDVGEHDGHPFFTMELVRGGSLKNRLDSGPLPPEQAAHLLLEVSRAIETAHLCGIIHRDLKPANVLLSAVSSPLSVAQTTEQRTTDNGQRTIPKIADFSLAKRLGSEACLTQTGGVLGTPSYMAPELASGKNKSVGPATDVYALGAVLYECLTGRPPFLGVTALDTLQQLQHLDPLKPRQLQPRVPRDLETICLKCLEKDSARRYASAGGLADDLQHFLAGEPIRARPTPPHERMKKWGRRHPAAALLLVCALALLAGFAGHLWQRQQDFDLLQREHGKALDAERLAQRNEAAAQDARYASDMRLADQLFRAGDVFQLPQLLDRHRPRDAAAEDRRGFEWWYLRQYARQAMPPLRTQDPWPCLLAYGPDGKSRITAGGANEKVFLKVWDASTRKVCFQQRLRGRWPGRDYNLCAITGDGAAVAGILEDQVTVALWDTRTGKERIRVPHQREVNYLSLSTDGRFLALSGDGLARLLECGTGKEWISLPTHRVHGVAVDTDCKSFVVGIRERGLPGISWYDPVRGSLLAEAVVESGVEHLSCSPRATYLLVIACGWSGSVWDNKRHVSLDWSLGRAVRAVAMSADERMLAAGDQDGGVCLWDVQTRQLRAYYRWQGNPIVQLAFSPDGRVLAAGTTDGDVYDLDATAYFGPDSIRLPRALREPLVWAPNGNSVAVTDWDGTVHLFDRRTGEMRPLLRCPQNIVTRMAFAADGQTLATVGDRSPEVCLWDVVNGQRKRTLTAHPGWVVALAFAPDGRRLATTDGREVRFWALPAGAPAGTLLPQASVKDLAFTPDGRFLVTAGAAIQVWDVSNCQAVRLPLCTVKQSVAVVHVTVASDGRLVATQEENGQPRLWKLSRDGGLSEVGPPLPVPPNGGANGLSFGPDGRSLLALHHDEFLLWYLPSRALSKMRTPLLAGALSPDGKALALVDTGRLDVWDLATWRVRRSPGQPLVSVHSLAFSPDGATLLSGGDRVVGRIEHETALLFNRRIKSQPTPLDYVSATVRSWDAKTGREIPTGLPGESIAAPGPLSLSPGGLLLAAGGEDGGVRVWDWPRRQFRVRLFVSPSAESYAMGQEFNRTLYSNSNPDYARFTEAVRALAFSPDGRLLAVSGGKGSLQVWKTNGWRSHLVLNANGRTVEWLAFTPDSSGLILARGGQVEIWDLSSRQIRTTLGDESGPVVLSGAISPNGHLLATGSKDRNVRLWDLKMGTLRTTLPGHQDYVTALAFTPGGKTLASASGDRTVRLWSLSASQEVAVLQGHGGKVQALSFSPNGQVLASGSDSGEILFWRAPRP